MIPEFVNGLPLHPLVVHGVVVLLPLAVFGTVVIAVWPAARRRFGWLVVGVAAVATALVPVATTSGNNLARRIPNTDLVQKHMHLADMMLWFAIGLLAVVVGLMVLDHLSVREGNPGWMKAALIGVAVLSVGMAVATGVHVFRTGEAGSRIVYDGVQNLPSHR